MKIAVVTLLIGYILLCFVLIRLSSQVSDLMAFKDAFFSVLDNRKSKDQEGHDES